jgi:zinc D-Ala-D-Ala carboxypeptidase
MIERDEILKTQTCPPELEINLYNLLIALNKFRAIYGIPMIVTSGYRTPEHNVAIGGAKNSAHCLCMAADFADKDRSLCNWILRNESILEQCGLWMEDPDVTTTWVHLQIRPTINRIFIP